MLDVTSQAMAPDISGAIFRIGGYVPCSLSDYPGCIAAVVFTQGCNWRCPWCHNTALVYPRLFTPPLSPADILARLAARKKQLDGVVISGGEPTLQAGLAAFATRVRALGFKIKLDTNGSRPHIVRELHAQRLVDFVAMDIKAPFTRRYDEAAGCAVHLEKLGETLSFLRESGIAHQLRTTRWPGLGADDMDAIRALAAGSPHVWQDHRPPEAPVRDNGVL